MTQRDLDYLIGVAAGSVAVLSFDYPAACKDCPKFEDTGTRLDERHRFWCNEEEAMHNITGKEVCDYGGHNDVYSEGLPEREGVLPKDGN